MSAKVSAFGHRGTTSSVKTEIVRELVNATDGAGLHFDGAGGNIDIASPPDLGTKFSFEIVIKADSTDASAKIIDFGDGGRFVIEHNTNGLQVKPSNAGAWVTMQSPSTLADLKVHHLVLTVDGTTATLFDNGNQIATDTISATDIDSCAKARIGGYYTGTSYPAESFDGTIYRCRFYNKALEPDEVQTAYERADVQYGRQPDLVTNGEFADDDDDDWSEQHNWGISDGKAKADGVIGNQQLSQAVTLTAGKKYKIEFEISGYSAGGVILHDIVGQTSPTYNSNGYKSFEFTAASGSNFVNFRTVGTTTLNIEYVKLHEIGCVTDYDFSNANPSISRTIQDRNRQADGTASASGVTQVQPVVQGNLTSLAVSSATARTPADGDIIADKIGVGMVPTAAVDVFTTGNNGIKTNNGTAQLYMGSTGGVAAVGTLNDNALNLIANGGVKATIASTGETKISRAGDEPCLELATDNAGCKLLFARSGDPTAYIRMYEDGAVGTGSLRFATGSSATPVERLTISSTGDITSTNATASKPILTLENTTGDNSSSQIVFYKNRSATNNDNLGTVRFKGKNNAGSPEVIEYATIYAQSTDVADGDEDGQLIFRTMKGGSLGARLTIDSTGLATFSNGITVNGAVGSFANGIYFSSQTGAASPASTSTSVLNHYEEGTWTPVIADAVSGGNTGSGTLKGYYTRTGNVVTVNASMSDIDTTDMTGANDLFIRGLPFPTGYAAGTNSDLGRAFGSCLLDGVNVDANCYGVVAVTSPLISYVKFAEMLDTNNEDRILVSELTSGSADIFFTLTYFVN